MTKPVKQKSIGVIAGPVLLFAVFIVITAVLVPIFTFPDRVDGGRDCQSNIKQLGIAFVAYSQDYDDRCPLGLVRDPCGRIPHFLGMGWAGQLYPYAKSAAAFKCPNDEEIQGSSEPISYAYNRNIPRRRLTLDQLRNPSKTVLLFEVSNAHAAVDLPNEGLTAGSYALSPAGDGTILMLQDNKVPRDVRPATGGVGGRPTALEDVAWPRARHSGGANYLAADGHVQWLPPTNVSSGFDASSAASTQTGTVVGNAAGTDIASCSLTFSTK